MKILFLSDIHGIVTNLEIIDTIIQHHSFDKIVVLGDLYSPWDNSFQNNNQQVSHFLLKHRDNIICLQGNCDSEVDIKATRVPIYRDLVSLSFDGVDFYLTHGHHYSYDKKTDFLNKKGVLIYGHFHVPYIKKENSMVYVCVGSISLPRGGSQASYAVYHEHTIKIYCLLTQEVIAEIKV